MNNLLDFAELAHGLNDDCRIKLALFASKTKPVTYLILKIDTTNIDEKHQFEDLLRRAGVLFKRSRAKGYEEITGIVKHVVRWQLAGVWFGYDLFWNKKDKQQFEKYVKFMRKEKYKEADNLGGKLYRYPSCCVSQYTKERNPKYIKRKYTYYAYFKKMHGHPFPFIQFTPCSRSCSNARKLNKRYEKSIKEKTPYLYKTFTKKQTHKTIFLIDTENDVLKNGTSVWTKKNGHDYILVTKTAHHKKYYMHHYLTKKKYHEGAELKGKAEIQHNHSDITIQQQTCVTKKLIHRRHLPVLGRAW